MANRKKRPTRACWEFLERVRKACKNTPAKGLVVTAPADTEHAVALRVRGWVEPVKDGRPNEYAITFTGEEALRQQKAKIKSG